MWIFSLVQLGSLDQFVVNGFARIVWGCVCVCVCVCVRARARVRACLLVRVCVCVKLRGSLDQLL